MPRPKAGERIRGPYEDKSRGRWRVDRIEADGSTRRRFFRSEAAAYQYRELLAASISAVERDTATAIEAYRRFLKQKGNKPGSIDRTLWSLRQFFPKPLPLASLKPARCKGLYDDLRTRPKAIWVKGKRVQPEEGEPLSADSHRAALKEAKSFLRWCVEQGWLAENPAEGVKPIGKTRPRGKSLGKAGVKLRIHEARAWYETAHALAAGGDEGAVAALVALELGLRASEIATRRVRDIDTAVEKGDVLYVDERKNGEDLAQSVGPELRAYLLKRAEGKEPEQFLFESRKGGPRTRQWVLAQVRRICKVAGVPRTTAHALRKMLADSLLGSGMPLYRVAEILGHDPKVTERHYAEPGAAAAGARQAGLKVLAGGKR